MSIIFLLYTIPPPMAIPQKDRPAQRHLIFNYIDYPEHFDFIYSNSLHDRLQEKTGQPLTANVRLRFHWGALAISAAAEAKEPAERSCLFPGIISVYERTYE